MRRAAPLGSLLQLPPRVTRAKLAHRAGPQAVTMRNSSRHTNRHTIPWRFPAIVEAPGI